MGTVDKYVRVQIQHFRSDLINLIFSISISSAIVTVRVENWKDEVEIQSLMVIFLLDGNLLVVFGFSQIT